MPDESPPPRGTTRQRLLRAAIELIAEAGWGGVSTRSVAERAGVNQALVHYHYRSVPGLLREAAHAAMAATFDPAMARLTQTPDPLASLRAMAAELARIDPHSPESLVVAEAAVQAVRDEELGCQVRHMLTVFREVLTQRLAAARDSGQLSPAIQPAGLATALAGLLDGLALHRLIDPGVDVSQAARAMLALLEQSSPAARTGG